MIQIGTYTIAEATTFRKSYETAAWYTQLEVPAGTYAIMAKLDAEGKVEDTSLMIKLEGTVTDANFQSLFGGVPCGGPYDNSRDLGKTESHVLSPYAHSTAKSIINGTWAEVELLPEFEAVTVDFIDSWGVPTTTYNIRQVGSVESQATTIRRYARLNYTLAKIDTEKDLAKELPAYLTKGLTPWQRRENVLQAIRVLGRQLGV